MQSPRAAQTLLLAPDPRQTVLATVGLEGLNRQSYSAYGHQHGPAVSRTGFNGQLREPQGWYHLGNGHRVYNPALMRFHSPDSLSPFGEGGLNGYAYCLGDPVNYTDPTGKLPDWFSHVAVPIVALAVGGSLLAMNLVTAAAAKATLVGPVLGAARLSIMGSALGIVGATTQLASPVGSNARSVGGLFSIAGSVLSIGGAATRFGIGLLKLWRAPESTLGQMREVVRILFLGQRKVPAIPKSPSAKVSVSPSLSRRGSKSSASSSNYLTASDGSASRRASHVRSGSESSYRSAPYADGDAGNVTP